MADECRAQVVLCPGTRLRARNNREYHTGKLRRGYWALHFGWRRGPFTNASAGCTMIFSRRIKRHDLAAIAGRGGMVRLRSGRFDWTVQVGYPPALTESGVQHLAQEKAIRMTLGIPSKKTLPRRSNEVHRSWIGVERSKRTSGPQERTESGRIRNGNFAPEYRQHLDHNNVLGILTYVFLTTRYLAYAGSQVGPVGIHHMVEECGVLCGTGRRLQLIPAGLPRHHMPILLTLRYTLQPQR